MNSSAKKKFKSAVSLVLVAALIVTGLYAFLFSKNEKRNKFTIGNVDIKLHESFMDVEDSIAYDPIITNLVANQKITKAPWIENTGDNSAYVYLTVGIPVEEVLLEGYLYPQEAELLTLLHNVGTEASPVYEPGINNGWTLVQNDDGSYYTQTVESGKKYDYYVFAYTEPIDPGETTPKLFDQVQYANVSNIRYIRGDEYLALTDNIASAIAYSQFKDSPVPAVTEGWNRVMNTLWGLSGLLNSNVRNAIIAAQVLGPSSIFNELDTRFEDPEFMNSFFASEPFSSYNYDNITMSEIADILKENPSIVQQLNIDTDIASVILKSNAYKDKNVYEFFDIDTTDSAKDMVYDALGGLTLDQQVINCKDELMEYLRSDNNFKEQDEALMLYSQTMNEAVDNLRFSVVYDLDGGKYNNSTSDVVVKYKYKDNIVSNAPYPSKTINGSNKSVISWRLYKDAQHTDFYKRMNTYGTTDMPPFNLYAVADYQQYTMYFDPNGGIIRSNVSTVSFLEYDNLYSKMSMCYDGYRTKYFNGYKWYTDSGHTNEITVDKNTLAPASNLYLVAQWSDTPTEFEDENHNFTNFNTSYYSDAITAETLHNNLALQKLYSDALLNEVITNSSKYPEFYEQYQDTNSYLRKYTKYVSDFTDACSEGLFDSISSVSSTNTLSGISGYQYNYVYIDESVSSSKFSEAMPLVSNLLYNLPLSYSTGGATRAHYQYYVTDNSTEEYGISTTSYRDAFGNDNSFGAYADMSLLQVYYLDLADQDQSVYYVPENDTSTIRVGTGMFGEKTSASSPASLVHFILAKDLGTNEFDAVVVGNNAFSPVYINLRNTAYNGLSENAVKDIFGFSSIGKAFYNAIFYQTGTENSFKSALNLTDEQYNAFTSIINDETLTDTQKEEKAEVFWNSELMPYFIQNNVSISSPTATLVPGIYFYTYTSNSALNSLTFNSRSLRMNGGLATYHYDIPDEIKMPVDAYAIQSNNFSEIISEVERNTLLTQTDTSNSSFIVSGGNENCYEISRYSDIITDNITVSATINNTTSTADFNNDAFRIDGDIIAINIKQESDTFSTNVSLSEFREYLQMYEQYYSSHSYYDNDGIETNIENAYKGIFEINGNGSKKEIIFEYKGETMFITNTNYPVDINGNKIPEGFYIAKKIFNKTQMSLTCPICEEVSVYDYEDEQVAISDWQLVMEEPVSAVCPHCNHTLDQEQVIQLITTVGSIPNYNVYTTVEDVIPMLSVIQYISQRTENNEITATDAWKLYVAQEGLSYINN